MCELPVVCEIERLRCVPPCLCVGMNEHVEVSVRAVEVSVYAEVPVSVHVDVSVCVEVSLRVAVFVCARLLCGRRKHERESEV